MKTAAIACEGLRHTYRKRKFFGEERATLALDGLNLAIEPNCVYGLLGPNGSGKTTLVRVLSTLLIPTSGSAAVMGHDVLRDASAVRRKIGLVLGGDRGLYGRLSGRDNLLYFAALNNIPAPIAEQRADSLFERVGLFDRRLHLVDEYSRGMKQRLHIARGLMTDPDVIFLDEPTIGLDPASSADVRQIVVDLRASGKTILLTTHYMLEADALCDRIAMIRRGTIIAEGTPSEIKGRLSGLSITEISVRDFSSDARHTLEAMPGLLGLEVQSDGVLHRLTLQRASGCSAGALNALLNGLKIEAMTEREPTLEETYLHLFK